MPAFKTFFWSWIFAASPSVFIFFVKQAGNPPIQPRLNQFEIMNPSCCLQFYPSGFVRSLLGNTQIRVFDVPSKGEIQWNNKSRSLIHFCHRCNDVIGAHFQGKVPAMMQMKVPSERAKPARPKNFAEVLFITQVSSFPLLEQQRRRRTGWRISVLVYAGVQ